MAKPEIYIAPTALVTKTAILGAESPPNQSVIYKTNGVVFVASGAFIGDNCVLSQGVRLFPYVSIETGAKIGPNVVIGSLSSIGSNIVVDGNTLIGTDSIIGGAKQYISPGSTIGSHVRCFGSLLQAWRDPSRSFEELFSEKSPTVEDGAFIGFNAKLIGDITVGERSYVVTDTIITRDVPPEHLAFGINEIYPWRSHEVQSKFPHVIALLTKPGGFFEKGNACNNIALCPIER